MKIGTISQINMINIITPNINTGFSLIFKFLYKNNFVHIHIKNIWLLKEK